MPLLLARQTVGPGGPSTVPTAVAAQPSISAQHRVLLQVLVSGLSVSTATCVTSPVDLIKTRLQLQRRQAGANASGPQPGMTRLAAQIVRTEGVGALWKGVVPAVARGLCYGGLRLGMYEPLKQTYQQLAGRSDTGIGLKVLAGMTAGGAAAAITSPMELVKTRMQAQSASRPSTWTVVRQVVQTDGVTGLWRGGVPGVIRASLLNAGQCATYDSAKRFVMRTFDWGDDVLTHTASASLTGLVTTTVTNPADVVKTYMYVHGSQQKLGAWAAARDIVSREGPSVLFRGWLANYARLGPQTLVTFLAAERFRQLVGLNSL